MDPAVMSEPVDPPVKIGERAATDVRVYSGSSSAELGVSVCLEDPPLCWICLDGGNLFKPCACPRMAHPGCVARWQLQSAGTRKETHCEFCDHELPDWKRTLTPQCGANAPAVMNVNFDGRTYSFEVKPGIDGYKQFTEAIRKAFSLPEDSELNITFTCDEPIATPMDASPASTPISLGTPMAIDEPYSAPTTPSGSLLTLQGAGAYDAAVHCASVSAARRIMQHQGQSPHYTAMPGPSFRQQAPDPRSTRPFGASTSQPPRFSGPAQEESQARRGNVFQKTFRKLTGRRGDKSD